MEKGVYLAFSYDTEQPVPDRLPPDIISEADYSLLPINKKKRLWADYLRDGLWENPAFLQRSLKELETIQVLGELFTSFGGEFTSFVLGQWLEKIVEALGPKKVKDAFASGAIDVQSHSYEHKTFLSTGDITRERISPLLPPEEISEQLRKSKMAISHHLGTTPIGLRTPMGNIAPFDNPEIIKLFKENGFQFVSSWLKKAQREANIPAEAQPFFYSQLEFPDILEIPGVGWFDVHHTQPTRMLVFDDEETIWTEEEFAAYYIGLIEDGLEAAENRPIFIPLVFHPWAVQYYDPSLKAHTEILRFAQKHGVRVSSYNDINNLLRK